MLKRYLSLWKKTQHFDPHESSQWHEFNKLLVHPKDRKNPADRPSIVYSIPDRNCNKVDVGEAVGQFEMRRSGHHNEAEELSKQHFTCIQKKPSKSTMHISAIPDHVSQLNHTTDWNNVKILATEDHRTTRKIRKAIHFRKRGPP